MADQHLGALATGGRFENRLEKPIELSLAGSEVLGLLVLDDFAAAGRRRALGKIVEDAEFPPRKIRRNRRRGIASPLQGTHVQSVERHRPAGQSGPDQMRLGDAERRQAGAQCRVGGGIGHVMAMPDQNEIARGRRRLGRFGGRSRRGQQRDEDGNEESVHRRSIAQLPWSEPIHRRSSPLRPPASASCKPASGELRAPLHPGFSRCVRLACGLPMSTIERSQRGTTPVLRRSTPPSLDGC